MNEQVLDEIVARKFLLGQLSPEQQGEVEELAFDDVDSYAFLESIEEELIDEYIQGELSATEREQFEKHFLSFPGRRDNLKLGQILQRHFSALPVIVDPSITGKVVVHKHEVPPQSRRSFADWFQAQRLWLRISFTAATLALLVFIVWLFFALIESQKPAPKYALGGPSVTPTPESSTSPTPQPTPSPSQPDNTNRSQPPDRPPERIVYALLLPSASVRDVVGGQSLPVPSNSASAPVGLALVRNSYRTYEATLENEADEVLHRWSNLRPVQIKGAGVGLEIEMPFAELQLQDSKYRIIVRGKAANGTLRDVARYPFAAVKQ